MATTTPTTTAQIQDPDTTAAVQRAREALDEITLRYTRLDRRRWTLERAINPHVDSEASADLVLEATEHLAAVRVEHARLNRQRRGAESSWLTARATAREEVRATSHTHKRQLVLRINEGLTAAATASRELAELEDQERRFTGSWHVSGFAWAELSAASPTQGSRLADWQSNARAAHLLD